MQDGGQGQLERGRTAWWSRRRRTATAALRRPARRAFYRSGSLRRLVAGARWPRLREELPDLAHLTVFNETADGPVQRDEALLLHSMIRVIRPRTVLEIGFLRGHSAFNFLRALDPEARLYSDFLRPRDWLGEGA